MAEYYLKDAIPSINGYIVRPYVELRGQRYGYFWSTRQKGFWRAFLSSKKKRFPLQTTGRTSNTNHEKHISSAYFGKTCKIDTAELKPVIEPYLRNRYFSDHFSTLPSMSRKFGSYNGSVYNVGLDAHEIRLHGKFQNPNVDNKHVHLFNAIDGTIRVDGSQYCLQFEIQQYDSNEPLAIEISEMSRGQNYNTAIQMWCYVPSDNIPNIRLYRKEDELGEFFVSDTSHYIPVWLRESNQVMNDNHANRVLASHGGLSVQSEQTSENTIRNGIDFGAAVSSTMAINRANGCQYSLLASKRDKDFSVRHLSSRHNRIGQRTETSENRIDLENRKNQLSPPQLYDHYNDKNFGAWGIAQNRIDKQTSTSEITAGNNEEFAVRGPSKISRLPPQHIRIVQQTKTSDNTTVSHNRANARLPSHLQRYDRGDGEELGACGISAMAHRTSHQTRTTENTAGYANNLEAVDTLSPIRRYREPTRSYSHSALHVLGNNEYFGASSTTNMAQSCEYQRNRTTTTFSLPPSEATINDKTIGSANMMLSDIYRNPSIIFESDQSPDRVVQSAGSAELSLESPRNNSVPSSIMTDDDDALERFVARIDPLTLSDVDSDSEQKSIEHNLKQIRSFVNKALEFVTAEKELVEDECHLEDLLQEAVEKEAVNALNLLDKGQHRRMRDIQLKKKFSSNTNEKNECAGNALNAYNNAVKAYKLKHQMRAPENTEELKNAMCKLLNMNLKQKKRKVFIEFATASDLQATTYFEEIFNALIKD